MKYEPATILSLVDQGLEQNETGVAASTKRKGSWTETSIQDFKTKAKHLALGLYAMGVRKGDRVSLHSENSTTWLLCDYAILSIGAINVPIYTTQPGDQIKYILENSETKFHIYSDDELFAPLKPHYSSIKTLDAVITVYGKVSGDVLSLDSIIEKGKEKDEEDPELHQKLKDEVKPDDLASFIYTSGTTGPPKGVMLTHNNIASNIYAALERVPFDHKKERRLKMLSFLPLSHIFERMLGYTYMNMGYPIYFIETLDEIVDDIQHIKPHFFATVPRLLEKVYAKMKSKPNELSGLRKKLFIWAFNLAEKRDIEKSEAGLKYKLADKLIYSKMRDALGGNLIGMISGGAALSPTLMQFFNGIGFYCGQGYGLTETAPVISVTDRENLRVGSVGKPITGVEVKIAEDGEIITKGPNVMEGYYKMPEATKEVLQDGWLKTGDIGKIDKDGFLFVTDRKKDLFKLSTGKYVAPQNIENMLANHPYIEQASIVGNAQKFCGALIVPAFEVVGEKIGLDPSDRKKISESDKARELIQKALDEINPHLAEWEQVKNFKLVTKPFTIDDGELTPTLKMKRRVIQDKYSKQIEEIYEEEPA